MPLVQQRRNAKVFNNRRQRRLLFFLATFYNVGPVVVVVVVVDNCATESVIYNRMRRQYAVVEYRVWRWWNKAVVARQVEQQRADDNARINDFLLTSHNRCSLFFRDVMIMLVMTAQ